MKEAFAALARAMAAKADLQKAAGDDWDIIAAIGMRETYFNNMKEYGWNGPNPEDHLGRGVFQIDIGQNPQVTEEQAMNVEFAASWSINKLKGDRSGYDKPWNFNRDLSLAEGIHDYNASPNKTKKHPNTWGQAASGIPGLDQYTTGHNYVSNILNLINCFHLGSE
jgi:hypothetical protein